MRILSDDVMHPGARTGKVFCWGCSIGGQRTLPYALKMQDCVERMAGHPISVESGSTTWFAPEHAADRFNNDYPVQQLDDMLPDSPRNALGLMRLLRR